jgi:hypothetical protein
LKAAWPQIVRSLKAALGYLAAWRIALSPMLNLQPEPEIVPTGGCYQAVTSDEQAGMSPQRNISAADGIRTLRQKQCTTSFNGE